MLKGHMIQYVYACFRTIPDNDIPLAVRTFLHLIKYTYHQHSFDVVKLAILLFTGIIMSHIYVFFDSPSLFGWIQKELMNR